MPKPGAVTMHESPAAALEELYRAEYVGMVRLAFTLVGSTAEAEEIVQDSFVEISQRLDGLRRPGAYLRSVVVSRCHTALRRRRVLQQASPDRPPDLSPDADTLWDVLERLSDVQRVVVVLRYYSGYRSAEIADVIGVPAATVRSHLRRALQSMRKELTT